MSEDYSAWIDRDVGATDTFDRDRHRRFDATFDREHDPATRHIAPMSHLIYLLSDTPLTKLGPDGHAEQGGFLPPIPLPRRMWAGSRIDFLRPIEFGSEVTRRSRVTSINEKTGKSGRLVFVTTEHEYLVEGATHLRDEQSLVFREEAAGSAAPPPGEARKAAHSKSITPTPVLLFRYSAITFNSHKIHYDHPYTTKVEGYPGLVVHGPLQATFLAKYATDQMPDRTLTSLTFRAQRPLFDLAPFTVNAAEPDGDTLDVWTADSDGFTAMSAKATFQ